MADGDHHASIALADQRQVHDVGTGRTTHSASEPSAVESYFDNIIARYPVRHQLSGFVVTHLLPDRPRFLAALSKQVQVKVILPKPKSVDHRVLQESNSRYICDTLTRERFQDPSKALDFFERHAAGESIVLLDVGGYFAPTLSEVSARFSGTIVGSVEDTENGHRRYADLVHLPCPVYSVARSPLKAPEDYLVGQSIVFSTEALLRGRGQILPGREACVIGFGKVGRSIASVLGTKSVRVTVYDKNPVRMTEALAHGFRVAGTRTEALSAAELVVCATGSGSLRNDDFPMLRKGASVVSVTSSDDEMELRDLGELYDHTVVDPHVHRYSRADHYFYLLNNGNAVNFVHGAVVGPFILLVQAEIIGAMSLLSGGNAGRGLSEVGNEMRTFIAQTWLDHFRT